MGRPSTVEVVREGDVVIAKGCPRCHEVKLAEAFGPDRRSKTGLASWCTACISIQAAARRAGMSIEELAADRSRRNENSRRWRKDNPEKVREAIRTGQVRYREQHGDRHRARAQLAYHWRDRILDLFNRCMACGSAEDLTLDHVIPLGQPGAVNDPSNVQVLCRACNSTKGERATDYRTSVQREVLRELG